MSSILIVDDNPSDYQLLISGLAEHGIDSAEFTDGLSAWWHLISEPVPQFILVDYNMPRLDGLQLIELIRGDPKFIGVPIAMTTFGCQLAVIERVKALEGFVLGKPLATKELSKLIVATIAAARPAAPVARKLEQNPEEVA